MEQNKSIVVFSSHSFLNYMLINRLAKEFTISYVIYEDQPLSKKLKLIKGRIKKLGIGKVLGQVLFHIFDKVYIKPSSQKRIQELLQSEDCGIPSVPSKQLINILDRDAPAALHQCLQVIYSPPCIPCTPISKGLQHFIIAL